MTRATRVRTVIELPDDQVGAVKRLAERLRLSRAELVRRSVSDDLHRQGLDDADQSFRPWKDHAEDGLAYQERMRWEWDR